MNIYVGNLADQITEDDLRQAFEAHGPVESINIIKDKLSGRPLGFGFVEIPDQDQARRAIEALSGTTIRSRAVIVAETSVRTERRQSSAIPAAK
ncbi:MAG: RNA recognition motif domain-containing protein [Planctomycetota bacterium]|jgi:RNA recognition motif-containing protein